VDDETAARIAQHQARRRGGEWRTFEETLDICGVIGSLVNYRVILVECLTLWVNNLMYHESDREPAWDQDRLRSQVAKLLRICRPMAGVVIFVTNEVGMGIVPGNPLSRRWRDLVGTCNQVVAEGADEAFLVACGLPLRLKGPASIPETGLEAPHAAPIP
jgi:adenosylcobinamide kinase/adenosylcobinamide-phosphate guanylyltransferase